MSSRLYPPVSSLLLRGLRRAGSRNATSRQSVRRIETLAQNKAIYIHPTPSSSPQTYTVTFLPTSPPNPYLALGTSTAVPPTPHTFTENDHFRPLLSAILKAHACEDPETIAEAQGVYATLMGAASMTNRGTGDRKRNRVYKGDSSGASGQGGAGGGNVGGWHHLVDRRTPYYGGMRIPEPQDILGSLEVDGTGKLVGGFQECESYRLITNAGMITLTPFLEGKLIERLKEEEARFKEKGL